MNSASQVTFALGAGLTLGGTNVWAVHMARRLSSRGVKVNIIEHERSADVKPLNMELPDDVQRLSCRLPTDRWPDRKELRAALAVYETCLPGIFLPTDTVAAYAMCAMLAGDHAKEMRMVSVGHGESDAYYSFMTYYEPISYHIIAVNSTMQGLLTDCHPDRKDAILLKPCPVNVASELNREYARPDSPIRIVYAGRIANYDKGAGNIVPVAAKLSDLGVDYDMEVHGSGPYERCLKQDLDNAVSDVQGRVRLMGQIPSAEMVNVWPRMDVVLCPSNFESTGLSMLEGMANGCVPVVTACNGPRDIIQDAVNGRILPIGDAVGLAEAVAELAGNRSRLQELGSNAHRTVHELYSYDDYMTWFLNVCTEVWAAPARTWPSRQSVLCPDPNRVSLQRRVFRKVKRVLGKGK